MARRLVPAVVFAAFAAYVAVPVLLGTTNAHTRFDIAGLRLVPVSVNGRVQPFDSAARIALRRIRGTAAVPVDGGGTPLDANAWLIEVIAKPDAADTRKIFPVGPELLGKIGVASAPTVRGAAVYLSFRDVSSKVAEIGKHTERIAKVNDADRAPWEREMLTLREKLVAYERLKNSVQPNSLLQREAKGAGVAFDFSNGLSAYRGDLAEAARVAERRKKGGADVLDPSTERRIRAFAGRFEGVSRIGLVAMVPPLDPDDQRSRWNTTGAVVVNSARGGRLPVPVGYVAALTSAYARGSADVFNETLAGYRRWLAANGFAPALRQAGVEAFGNLLQPFVRAVAVYGVALALFALAWGLRSPNAYRSAVALVVLAAALHTVGLVVAYLLAGRPSSLTLAGWAASLAAMALERWRRGAGLALCAAVALTALCASYALVPGGAGTLLRNLPTVGLLMAVEVAAVALVAASIFARPSVAPGERRAREFGHTRRHTAAAH